MTSEKITLRTNPLFEFEFLENGFEVTDDSKDNTNRFYHFEHVNNVEAKTKSSNLLITIINFIFFGGPKYHYYERQKINFKYGKEEVVILIENSKFKTLIKI